MRVLLATALLLAAFGRPQPAWSEAAGKSVFEWAGIRLEYVRDERLAQLRHLCRQVHERARAISTDEVMRAMFDAGLSYADIIDSPTPPPELAADLKELKDTVNNYYIVNYNMFYNILFVGTRGDVLYSIRRSPDYRANLFSGILARTPLSRALKKKHTAEVFVDFHQFAPADDVAAFFIEPYTRGGTLRGWFVLQWPLNKINALFAGSEALGPSGETFLVNRGGYMLTESSFKSDSTILQTHLDRSNVETKFSMRRGRKTVTDYRGATALTAFEVFPFLDTEWLVVAKMDEAQVLTTHYAQHQKYYADMIARHIRRHIPAGNAAPVDIGARKTVRVDMDEFVRVNRNEILRTYGVSTCTALVAVFPGKFGYLAHISPYDTIYGGTATSLVGHVLKKIKNYDIYKFERDQIRFTIVARHLETMPQIVNKLIEEGFYLSQITVLHQPDAASADVTCDYQTGRTVAAWHRADGGQPNILQDTRQSPSLSAILKSVL